MHPLMNGDPSLLRCIVVIVERTKEKKMPMQDNTPLTYSPSSPIMKEIKKGPVDFLPHKSYGVRKLKERIRVHKVNRHVRYR